MPQLDANQEEVTTIKNESPQQVIRKTTMQSKSKVKGEVPQKVYETKKTIFRFNQVVWYILGVIEIILGFRMALKALGANPFSGFTSLIYTISDPLALPFRGILGTSSTQASVFEWSTIVAAIVYLCIAWGLVYLLNLIYPITPKDVETQ
ncbi:MAG TPA: hypothetical protein VFD45_01940 [Patescibacteria group bacterium]|nr:hypothetical protein [Patescibacteria group bacterium]